MRMEDAKASTRWHIGTGLAFVILGVFFFALNLKHLISHKEVFRGLFVAPCAIAVGWMFISYGWRVRQRSLLQRSRRLHRKGCHGRVLTRD
jgi:cytochrome bd-type quinol oxidase subunit 1